MIALLILLSCNKDEGISPEDIASIWVEPENVELVTTTELAGFQDFEAYVELKTGEEYALDLVSWEISNLSSGTINSDGEFSAVQTNGGVTEIIAKHLGHEARASITVVYQQNITVGELEQAIYSAFESSDPTISDYPAILYPYGGVTVPRNLDGLGFSWDDDNVSSNQVYRIRFQTEITDISVYTSESEWISNHELWELISAANKQGEVEVYIETGVWDGTQLSDIRRGPSIGMIVNRLDARGSVLYWGGSTGSIMRIPISEAQSEVFIEANNCVGCHALVDSSSRLVVTHGGVDGRFSVFDVEEPTDPFEIVGTSDFNRLTFKAVSPDGKFIFGTNGPEATLYELETGVKVKSWMFEYPISHPDWAPDGDEIIAVIIKGTSRSDMEFTGGEIVRFSLNRNTLELGPEEVVIPYDPSINFYYPAYSPDGQWIAYNRSSNENERGCYAAPDAELWLMSRDGSIDIRLDNANGEGDLQNSYPRWGPLPDDDVLWLAYSSRRPYALQDTPNPQIWLTAIRPDRALDGLDPSDAPLWLPGQDNLSDNHLPVWWSK
jgi:dipeptidyl aminopeptidase/acylaminoacyl peptidase